MDNIEKLAKKLSLKLAEKLEKKIISLEDSLKITDKFLQLVEKKADLEIISNFIAEI